jgi:hypothetical protein
VPGPQDGRVGRRRAQHAERVLAEEVGDDDQRAGAALLQHVRGLRTLEARVDRHEHAPGPVHAQGGEHPAGAVGRPDRDPVAGPDAEGQHGPHARQHLLLELGEGQPEVAVDERFTVAVQSCGPAHRVRDAHALLVVPDAELGRDVVPRIGHRPSSARTGISSIS